MITWPGYLSKEYDLEISVCTWSMAGVVWSVCGSAFLKYDGNVRKPADFAQIDLLCLKFWQEAKRDMPLKTGRYKGSSSFNLILFFSSSYFLGPDVSFSMTRLNLQLEKWCINTDFGDVSDFDRTPNGTIVTHRDGDTRFLLLKTNLVCMFL